MAKKKDNNACIKDRLNDFRFGMEHHFEREVATNNQELQEHFEQGDFTAVKLIVGPLELLSQCYAMRGVLSIVDDGDAKGWADVDLSILYQNWQVKLAIGARIKAIHQGLKALSLYHEMPDIVSILCYNYVHGLREQWEELWSLWQMVLATPAAIISGKNQYWDKIIAGGYYELFVSRMFINSSMAGGAKLPQDLEELPLGPYQPVLDTWNNPATFDEPLRGICDYHCQSMEQGNARHDPWPPFVSTPFSLIPYEILAIYKLRSEQGLETPEIEHPLLALPTASREHREVKPINDPVFEQLEKLYQEQCLA